jgi:hypothetical protein
VRPAAYQHVVASLATMHGKQWPLKPLLRRRLGLRLVTADVDTDVLGTFTGEVPRPGDAEQVALRKARLGMAATGAEVGLASEGSFGAYPGAPWIPADREHLALVDDRLGFTLVESVLTTQTNHGSTTTDGRDLGGLLDFARRTGFPSHGLTVTPAGVDPAAGVVKGVHRLGDLLHAVRRACRDSPDGRAVVAADLRAHTNPTRMRAIAAAGRRLADRLATGCPGCGSPGYGRTGVERGLPCGGCGGPTELVAAVLLGCVRCAYRSRSPVGGTADPGCCPRCNP